MFQLEIFGISRETVRKILEYAVRAPTSDSRPIRRPKLEPWLGVRRTTSASASQCFQVCGFANPDHTGARQRGAPQDGFLFARTR